MKRLLAVLTVLALLMPSAGLCATKVMYKGIVTKRYGSSYTVVYKKMDKESTQLTKWNPGTKIDIVQVYPNWVEVVYNNTTGFILRNRIDVTDNVDPVNVPHYPAVQMHYYAQIDRDVDVKSEKDEDSETLSTLTDGARIAIIDTEDGWAKVIYHRQYGFINTNDLDELIPVEPDPETAGTERPIAVFTSFYNDNENRINNLAVASAFISKVMRPGESMNFNETVGPFNAKNGYLKAPVLVDEKVSENYGGGSCQVSSTLWDTLIQLMGINVIKRVPHGSNGASYLPHGMDASSGRSDMNMIFRNDYDFNIRIDASTHDYALFMAVYRAE